ncbi:MAG: ArnT family glycosyltransferase, partial [Chloroflexota bacterium]
MLQKVYNSQQRIITFLSRGNNSLILLITLSAFFCFWKLGSEPLNEWDESRNGVNAVEMIQNGDYVNLYYAGEPDTWNAKPPLMIWLIAASFKIFGYNEFALRFPAAMAAFLSLIVFFHLVSRYSDKVVAFFTCIILLTVDGIVGKHVGRTGDFDALMLLFLLISVYYFLSYVDFNSKKGLFLSAVFLGLAFYTKGLASLIIVPGLFVYAVFTKKLLSILKD